MSKLGADAKNSQTKIFAKNLQTPIVRYINVKTQFFILYMESASNLAAYAVNRIVFL